MITFPNGRQTEFLCAAGTLGADGNDKGHGIMKLYKKPLRWLGILNPQPFGFISKTYTFKPTRGNMRWYAPWRCVRYLGNGNWVNSVGLTNDGIASFYARDFYTARDKCGFGIIIPSLKMEGSQTTEIVQNLNNFAITAIEVNISCPNVKHDGEYWEQFNENVRCIHEYARVSKHPIIVKLGWRPDEVYEYVKKLDNVVFAFDLINTVPYTVVYPGKKSPLDKYGLEGGVSGPDIAEFANKALVAGSSAADNAKLISGGGINGKLSELIRRYKKRASAFTLGVDFNRPWVLARLLNEWQEWLRSADHQPA